MSTASRISYDDVVAWVQLVADRVRTEKTYLTELDSAIGDADHGINMDRGFQAVLAKLPALPVGDVGAFFKGVGMTLISTVGGASGPLYGTFFLQLGGGTAGKAEIELSEFATGLDAGIAGIQRLGKAEPGDKTMLDALLPARDALRAGLDRGDAPVDALSPPSRRPSRACSPRSRSSPARVARATSESAARVTRTRARRPRISCSRLPPTPGSRRRHPRTRTTHTGAQTL